MDTIKPLWLKSMGRLWGQPFAVRKIDVKQTIDGREAHIELAPFLPIPEQREQFETMGEIPLGLSVLIYDEEYIVIAKQIVVGGSDLDAPMGWSGHLCLKDPLLAQKDQDIINAHRTAMMGNIRLLPKLEKQLDEESGP